MYRNQERLATTFPSPSGSREHWASEIHQYEVGPPSARRAQMNVLSVASDNHFADRVENWEEVIGMMVSIAKAR